MGSDPRPQRLLVVRPTLGRGGADQVTLMLLRHLDRQRFQPMLALMRAEGPWLDRLPSDVPVVDLGSGGIGRRLYSAWWPLVRLLRSFRPEVVLSTSSGTNLVAALAHRLAASSARLVLSERSTLSRDDRSGVKTRLLLAAKRLLYSRADCVATVSDGVKQEVQRRLRLPAERVVRADSPILPVDFTDQASAEAVHRWLAPTSPPSDEALILAAGRLVAVKDFAMLIEAFARLRRQRPARLIILGEGPERTRLTALVHELGIADSVDLPGFDTNPYRFMSRCTLFVLSSRWEGMPGVLIQAMACGAPAVATDCETGPREIIRDGENGLLVRVGDATEMAAALDRLLTDDELRGRLAKTGRDEVTSRFDVIPAVAGWEALLAAETDR